MDDSKIALPYWLPWATTAVFAALCACLGELWIVERTRTQLLRDESALAATALQASDNQLEAERIVNRRELEVLGKPTAGNAGSLVALLAPQQGGSALSCGAVVWDPATQYGTLTCSRGTAKAAEGTYQLWLVGPGGSALCGVLTLSKDGEPNPLPISLGFPAAQGCQFVLVASRTGLEKTLPEALASGSIVLASPTR